MVEIKQTKVVYTERESATGLLFVLFKPTPPSRGRVLYKQTLIVLYLVVFFFFGIFRSYFPSPFLPGNFSANALEYNN